MVCILLYNVSAQVKKRIIEPIMSLFGGGPYFPSFLFYVLSYYVSLRSESRVVMFATISA